MNLTLAYLWILVDLNIFKNCFFKKIVMKKNGKHMYMNVDIYCKFSDCL